MKQRFARILMVHPDIGITVDQWVLLQLIYRHQSLSQQELGELAFKDAPTVTRILDILVDKKLVLRNIDLLDRRKFTLSLTTQGKRTYKLVLPLLYEFRSEAYDNIPDEELSIVNNVMSKIFENLSKLN